jgi:Uma2 family endonuclease
MLTDTDLAPDRVRPLLRAEYDRLVDSGAFEEERVELLEGVLATMSPQKPPHAHTVHQLSAALFVALGGRAVVRSQLPIAMSDDSEPEPDLAVVPPGDYSREHPSEALLVVEVALSSQRRDRIIKGRIYARAGVPEYWVVDLISRTIDVHKYPRGAQYTRITGHGEDETLRLSAFPDVQIHIGSILPTNG